MGESDKANRTGKDFEFLITGEIEIPTDKFNDIMTPKSYPSKLVIHDKEYYYEIDGDRLYYSWEPPGIQMTFNPEISYTKAKQIADEIIKNILATGQQAELLELDSDHLYRFE